MLINTFLDAILYEPIKRLDLLVDNTILLEESIDDDPLVFYGDLFFSILSAQ